MLDNSKVLDLGADEVLAHSAKHGRRRGGLVDAACAAMVEGEGDDGTAALLRSVSELSADLPELHKRRIELGVEAAS